MKRIWKKNERGETIVRIYYMKTTPFSILKIKRKRKVSWGDSRPHLKKESGLYPIKHTLCPDCSMSKMDDSIMD